MKPTRGKDHNQRKRRTNEQMREDNRKEEAAKRHRRDTFFAPRVNGEASGASGELLMYIPHLTDSDWQATAAITLETAGRLELLAGALALAAGALELLSLKVARLHTCTVASPLSRKWWCRNRW